MITVFLGVLLITLAICTALIGVLVFTFLYITKGDWWGWSILYATNVAYAIVYALLAIVGFVFSLVSTTRIDQVVSLITLLVGAMMLIFYVRNAPKIRRDLNQWGRRG